MERPSPTVSAQSYPNKIRKGNDGKEYISRADKNGVYHWKVLKGMGDTKNPEEYYLQFPDYKPQKYNADEAIIGLRNIAPKLKKLGIYVINVGWDTVWDFSDYHFARIEEILHSRKLDTNTPTVSYSSHRKYWASRNGEFYLKHNLVGLKRQDIINIFTEEFGKRFEWDGKNEHSILIKLKKL